ncbi:MAG: lipase family protein [Sphaerospermopsis sp. SIO1G2]|nr:lipase family protein [Sphaerospermopsis sp. SIO1G2]
MNNVQFKQVGFLSTEEKNQGFPNCGQISLGFNKMYTTFRPGILLRNKFINNLEQTVNEKVIELIEKSRGFDIEEKSIYQAINEFYFDELTEPLDNTNIYITGHSLGGALATIATMDIVATDRNLKGDNIKPKLKNPVTLYTFASPRLGDNVFADKFNELTSNNYIRAFRLANSEDLVTKVPLSVWFRTGIDIDEESWDILDGARSTFNAVTGGVFETDYQHVGIPIYFTHQARRYKKLNEEGEPVQDQGGKPVMEDTATLGDNHNMTASYCGALPNSTFT